MTELAGRELDAAIARGLGLEIAQLPGFEPDWHYKQDTTDGSWYWRLVPEFHTSIDATVEHCGLQERKLLWWLGPALPRATGYRAQVRPDEPGGPWGDGEGDTPALALARAVLAAQEAERE